MFTSNQLEWPRFIGEVIGGIFLYLLKSPLKRAAQAPPAETPAKIVPHALLTMKGHTSMSITDITKLLSLAPVIVAGVEQLHSDASGETKQQLAQESLTLATGVSDAVAPGVSGTTDAVSSGISAIIDSVVSIFNATGLFSHKSSSTTPATA